MIGGVVLDIDDTLYLERDYVRSGFLFVAKAVASSEAEATSISDWLWTAFEAGIRGDTFDRLLVAFPSVATRTSAATLVSAYRAHPPTIALGPGVEGLLQALSLTGVRLGAVTDGPPEAQTAKARALGLDRWLDPIILTGELGPEGAKPSTRAFEIIASAWSIPNERLVYVGDNPLKDFRGPRALGWRTIRVRQEGQLRYALEPGAPSDAPDLEIPSLDQLPDHLDVGA